MILKYFTILPITAYLIYIVIKYGIQKSISESAYELPEGRKLIFFIALVSTSMLMITGYVIEQPEIKADSIVLFFAGLGICYTASAYNFKENKIVETWHMAGAYGGYILGYVFIVIVFGLNSVFFIIPSLILIWIVNRIEYKRQKYDIFYVKETNRYYRAKTTQNNFVWWAEIIGLITIYLATIL